MYILFGYQEDSVYRKCCKIETDVIIGHYYKQ